MSETISRQMRPSQHRTAIVVLNPVLQHRLCPSSRIPCTKELVREDNTSGSKRGKFKITVCRLLYLRVTHRRGHGGREILDVEYERNDMRYIATLASKTKKSTRRAYWCQKICERQTLCIDERSLTPSPFH